jgi:hypothetical protein
MLKIAFLLLGDIFRKYNEEPNRANPSWPKRPWIRTQRMNRGSELLNQEIIKLNLKAVWENDSNGFLRISAP